MSCIVTLTANANYNFGQSICLEYLHDCCGYLSISRAILSVMGEHASQILAAGPQTPIILPSVSNTRTAPTAVFNTETRVIFALWERKCSGAYCPVALIQIIDIFNNLLRPLFWSQLTLLLHISYRERVTGDTEQHHPCFICTEFAKTSKSLTLHHFLI